MAGNSRPFGAIAGVYKHRLVRLFAILSIFTSHLPLATVVHAADPGVEFGAEDDLTVLGVQGGGADPDVEIKGFTVFGTTQTAYPGGVPGPGNVVVNGILSVSSGAYFAADSTFTAISVGSITTSSAGVIFSTNVFVTSGNVGIGTTGPKTDLQLRNRMTLQGVVNTQSLYGNNVYHDGAAWRLIEAAAGGAVRMGHIAGGISFHTIASGAAGADVSTEMDASGIKMVIVNNGNVGIGTYPPTSRLFIEKDSAYTGDASAAHGINIYTGAPPPFDNYLYMGADYTNGLAYIQSKGNGATSKPLILQGSGGNVGIGTTTPGARLDVSTNSAETTYPWGTGQLRITNQNTGAGIFSSLDFIHGTSINGAVALKKGAGNDAALTFWTNNGTSVGEKLRIDKDGSVGIGETGFTGPGGYEAYTKLWVTNKASAGDQAMMRINSRSDTNAGIWLHRDTQTKGFYLGQGSGASGFLKLTYGTGANEGAALTDAKDGAKGIVVDESGNVGVGASPSNKFHVQGTGGGSAGIYLNDAAPLVNTYTLYNSGGNLYWNGSVIGGGSQTPWTSAINAAGYTLNGNSTASGNLTLDSTSDATKGYVLLNPTGGNVGIGTAAPGRKLEISSTTVGASNVLSLYNPDATQTSSVEMQFRTGVEILAKLEGLVTVAGNNGGGFAFKPRYGVDGTFPTRMLIDGNGNVGIGTTGPAWPLHIYADEVNLALDATSGGTGRQYRLYSDNGGKFGVYDGTAGLYRMTIDSAGNVGIGTTNPNSRLEVNGTLAIGSNGADNDIGLSRVATRQLRFDSAPTTGTGITVHVGTTSNQNSTLIVNGSVGIGTTSPGTKLHVELEDGGTSDIISALGLRRNSTGTTAAGFGTGLYLQAEDAGGFAVNQGMIQTKWLDASAANRYAQMEFLVRGGSGWDSTPEMVIDRSGNVGIGTTNPGSKLEVNGNVGFTGATATAARINSCNYTGNGTANRAIAHGLGVVPKLILISQNDGTYNYHIYGASGAVLWEHPSLHGTIAVTAADATNFYVGNATDYWYSANYNAIVYQCVVFG